MLVKLVVAAALAAAAVCPASAQPFPSKVVRVTSPYSSGSGPDIFARVLAERLSRIWGQQVIVDARPGANGFIALEAVKKGAPDGHELVMVGNAHVTINPSLFKKVPYDVEADFAPVALLYRTPFFVTVAADSPYRSVGDLIAAAKAAPGKLTYGSPYVGSPAHLGGVALETLTGTQMVHVPFKDSNQLYIAITNNDLSWAFGTLGSTNFLTKSGKLRLLAIAARSRLPSHPDVPTVAQSGGPADLQVDAWVALLAPRATPAETVRRISADAARAMGEPEMAERLRTLGFESATTGPAELAELIRADAARSRELIRRIGAVPE